MNEILKGDVIVIYGDLKPEVKFVSAERFTKVIVNPGELIYNNKFYPRILLATAGSIGAGLDSPDVFSVCLCQSPHCSTPGVSISGVACQGCLT